MRTKNSITRGNCSASRGLLRNSYPRDGIFNLYLTTSKDSYNLPPTFLAWQYSLSVTSAIDHCFFVSPGSKNNLKYHSDPNFLDRQVRANSIDTNQTDPDQSLHCLPFCLYLLDKLLYGKTPLSKFEPCHEKSCLSHMRTIKVQISLRIRAV